MISRKQIKRMKTPQTLKKKICLRAKHISDPVKDKLSPSENTWKRFNQSSQARTELVSRLKNKREKVWNCSAPPPHISC